MTFPWKNENCLNELTRVSRINEYWTLGQAGGVCWVIISCLKCGGKQSPEGQDSLPFKEYSFKNALPKVIYRYDKMIF